MEKVLLLLLFCHVSSPVKHSLKYFLTVSSGVSDLPGFVGFGQIDNIQLGYCDIVTKIVKSKQAWIRNYFKIDPEHLIWYTRECLEFQPTVLKARISSLMQRFNQSEGAHILQRISGCEWDEETEEVTGFMQYGYDGEDFLSLDLKTQTWIAPKPQAVVTKLRWDTEKEAIRSHEWYLTKICPDWVKKYVDYGRSSLLRTALPSVSLLQKTPSSPVSCHATGFYPDRAMMFWRKDGEELDEDVDRGEILPNHDGTFQMRADLNISSVSPEDWRRYDCVFQLSGVKEDIIKRLDQAEIRTNREEPSNMTTPIIVAVVVVFLFIVVIFGFLVYKRKKAKSPPSDPDNSSELSENLNPGN